MRGVGVDAPYCLRMEEKLIRWHIVFRGEVQFVGFRHTAYRLAKSLGLTGWVKNLDDGTVEAEAQGSVSLLRKWIIALKSQPYIHITGFTVREIAPVPRETRFSVRDLYQ